MKKPYIIFILLSVFLLACNTTPKVNYTRLSGKIFGTYYHITYFHPEGKDLHEEVLDIFDKFDLSLSTFNSNSVISKINRNEENVLLDSFFLTMYAEAQDVSKRTDGAFDITVAPLVNAWGFGTSKYGRKTIPDVQKILPYIGYQKIKIKNNKLIKEDSRIMLDASAIAKGLSSDIVAQLLESYDCEHYMVEVGGEIACKGKNPSGNNWIIGIDKPTDESLIAGRDLQTKLSITDCGLATSGGYRQYYYLDGKKYSHTIDPRTAYPINHNLLSATVIASSCMRADAYATAFMVLGVDSSLAICKAHSDIECYLIYTQEDGSSGVAFSEGFEKYFAD